MIASIPTTKTKGTFVGTVELSGKADIADDNASNAFMSRRSCVYLKTVVNELRKSNKSEVWETIYEKEEAPCFYLRDETGAVRVDPRGAEITPLVVYDTQNNRNDPRYVNWAHGAKEAKNSRGKRQFIEYAIPRYSSVYVLGRTRVRDDAVAVEVAKDEAEPIFLIAAGDEETTLKAQRDSTILQSLAFVLGFAGAAWCLRFLRDILLQGKDNADFFAATTRTTALWIACVCLFVWVLRASLDYVNSFVDFRRRVDQAKANVDVELKRRADLIPALADATRLAASREAELQALLATLRSREEI